MRIKVDLDGGVKLLWPTPFLQRSYEGSDAFNSALVDIIRRHKKDDVGVSKSVVAGWHSRADVMSWPELEIGQLRDRIVEAVKDVMLPTTGNPAENDRPIGTITAWANILRSGGYHRPHTHPGCVWSGVYYIETGKPDPNHPTSGKLELYDPRTAVEMVQLPVAAFGQPFSIDPKPGMMVVFPSWLRHMVHPFVGKGERITIAWNMLLTEGPATS